MFLTYIDLRSTYIKKCKKARKTGKMQGHEPHILTLRTREKK